MSDQKDGFHDMACVSAHTALESAISTMVNETGDMLATQGIPRKRVFGVLMAALGSVFFDTCNMQIGAGLGLEEAEAPKEINLKRLDIVLRQCANVTLVTARDRYPDVTKQLLDVAADHATPEFVKSFNDKIKESLK